MTYIPQPRPQGLYGSGLVCDCEGAPLRPGGLALTETLIEHAGFRADDLVADIGCGQGASIKLMMERGIVAIGIDADPVAWAQARVVAGTTAVMVADGARLPFTSESLDGLLSECSLSLMGDRGRALAEWFRVLRPGGCVAISDVYSRRHVTGSACTLATSASLIHAVTEAGFYLERFEDRSEVLKMWAARFIFQYGSLDALWGGACRLDAETARKAAPGYCLLVAVKPHSDSWKGACNG